MNSRKVILRRITALYVVFFVVIAIGAVRSLGLGGDAFHTGLNDGRRMYAEQQRSDRSTWMIYDVGMATSAVGFDVPVRRDTTAGGTTVYARPASLDFKVSVSGQEPFAGRTLDNLRMLCGILSVLIYAAVFVILFIVIGALRRSIRNDSGFSRTNIALTRVIGLLLILASLLFSLTLWLEARMVAPYLEGTAYVVNTSFPFNFSELLMGVVIFVIAEIFSINATLTEEQKLTI